MRHKCNRRQLIIRRYLIYSITQTQFDLFARETWLRNIFGGIRHKSCQTAVSEISASCCAAALDSSSGIISQGFDLGSIIRWSCAAISVGIGCKILEMGTKVRSAKLNYFS